MVVRHEEHQSRSAAGCSRGSSTSIHRRVRVGLGSPFGRPPHEWELVDEGGHSTHQSLGNVRGPLRPTGLPSTTDRSHSAADVRQLLSGFVEWTLHQSVFKALCITWDTPNLDLFATRLNNRLPVFVSPMADPLAVDVDAMSMSWNGMNAYAFPPFVMLGRVLEKVLKDHPYEMVLVAPKWPNQSWYARLLELLVDFPLVLPLREDLLFQPHNHQRHRSLPAVCLHAWRLSSDPLQREDFRRQLPIRTHAVEGNPPERSMTANG